MATVVEPRAFRRRYEDRPLQSTTNSGFQFPSTGYPKNLALSIDLRQDPGAWEDEERCKTLWGVFPGISEIGFTGNVLSFVVDVLPLKPWPLTVAGVPVYVSTGYSCVNDLPPPRTIGQLVWNRNHPKVHEDHNGKNLDNWDEVFDIILGYFNSIEIEFTEVIYKKNAVTIILNDDSADMARVPFSICQLTCFYASESEMCRGQFLSATSRSKSPTPDSPDTCVYDTLRPGVMVSSGKIPGTPQFWTTTAGVMIQDRNGKKFVTVADHGFPPACGRQIMHPTPQDVGGRCIGKKAGRVGMTDIALIELNTDETFVNELFAGEDFPEGKRLQKLLPAQQLPREEIIYMDSPETGAVAGSHLFTTRCRVPADDLNSGSYHWLRGSWVYFVQNENCPLPNSICGSTICDSEGNVVAFFCFAAKSGPTNSMCFAIGADELVNRGYTLC